MVAKVFLNGEPFSGEISKENSIIIACDKGYKYCVDRGLRPNYVIGDFDSLGYTPNGAQIFPVEKDFTDGEGAISLLDKIKADVESVEFYNFGGGREDHFLCNLSLLVGVTNIGLKVKGITNFCDVYFAKNSFSLKNVKNKTISLVAFLGKVNINSGVGFKYDPSGKTLSPLNTLGISNVATTNEVSLTFDGEGLFIFVVKGEI